MRRFFLKHIPLSQVLILLICLLFLAACKKDDETFPVIDVQLENPSSYRTYEFGDTIFIKGNTSADSNITKVELSLSDDNFIAVSDKVIFTPKTKTFEADTFIVLRDPLLHTGDYVVQFKVNVGDFHQRDHTIVGYKEEDLELNSWLFGESNAEGTVLYSRDGNDLIPYKNFDFQSTFAHTVPEASRFIFADAQGVHAYNYLLEFDLWDKASNELFTGGGINSYTFHEKEFYFGAQEANIRKLGHAGTFMANLSVALNFNLMHMTAFEDQLFTALESVAGDEYQMVVYYDPTSAVQTVVPMNVYGKPLAFFQKNKRFFYVLTEKNNENRVYLYDIDANTMSLKKTNDNLNASHFIQLDPNRFCMINDQTVYVYDSNTEVISELTSVNYSIDHISFEKENGHLFLMDENHITQHNIYSNTRVFEIEKENDLSFVLPVYNK